MKERTKKIGKVASVIAGSLVAIHAVNTLVFKVTTMKELLYCDSSKEYDWRFGKIFYRKKGSGAPILLIHDLTTASSHYEFKSIEQQLSNSYTVYTIDLLGFGRSDKPKMTYTNYLYVQLIHDFIQDVIQQETILVTSGQSSSTGVMYAAMNQDSIRQLVLINPVSIQQSSYSPNTKDKLMQFLLDTPIVGTAIYNMYHSKYCIRNRFKKQYYATTSYPIERHVEAYSEAAHLSGSCSKYVFSSIACGYLAANVSNALKTMTTPITILAGEEVPKIDTILDSYEALNPNIECNFIQNTNKLPHLEDPKVFLTALENILEG